ncbi:MAG: hypothetical protein PHE74_00605 [Comamonas sp.]|jgi:hypothetical protein|nr:hypothetical protein [Comamonas sp.]
MGHFVVSPATHPTACGRYSASFAVHRAKDSSQRRRRVFRFDTTFASREAARIFAVTQGWVQTCISPAAAFQ